MSPSGMFSSDPNATPLDDSECQGLLPSISTRAELNAFERLNINAARAWAMRPKQLKREDLLSDHFARELHRRMFNRVWRWSGKYRTVEKNLGWAPHRIAEGVRNVCLDARAQSEHHTFPIVEIAVRLHHQLAVIHPWPNGNGRHARLMADVFVAACSEPELAWGRNDLVPVDEIRRRYIQAMQHADRGDFRPIVAFAQS